MFEFTTTATIRPTLLDRTYSSFSKNLLGVDFKSSCLYINIDPYPKGADPMGVVRVAEKHFGKVEYNITEEGNFCKAVKWCFANPVGDNFFHLEDDWEMNRKVKISNLEKRLREEKLEVVSLRAYPMMIATDSRICLSPSLFDTKFARFLSENLNDSHNPEKQVRIASKNNPIGGLCDWAKGSQFPLNQKDIIIRDIGRDWMKKVGFKKKSIDKGFFNSWKT